MNQTSNLEKRFSQLLLKRKKNCKGGRLMKKLTEKQKKILDFIGEFVSCCRMAPTVYEIAEHFEIKTSTVFAHLKALQKKNYLDRSSKARSISLKKTCRVKKYAGVQAVPLHNNNNSPLFNKPSRKIYYDTEMLLSKQKVKDLPHCFAVMLEENCYLSCGILPGDIVILLENPVNIQPGDLIMTSSDDNFELLKCKKIQDHTAIFLSFHGDDPIKFPEDAIPMKGVVIGIQRAL